MAKKIIFKTDAEVAIIENQINILYTEIDTLEEENLKIWNEYCAMKGKYAKEKIYRAPGMGYACDFIYEEGQEEKEEKEREAFLKENNFIEYPELIVIKDKIRNKIEILENEIKEIRKTDAEYIEYYKAKEEKKINKKIAEIEKEIAKLRQKKEILEKKKNNL